MRFFNRSKEAKAVVPVVSLKGVIQAGGRSVFGGAKPLNIETVKGNLTKAFNTAGAVAVALDINSPGGSPTQSELIGKYIRRLAEEKNIPVYAFAQDVAASGGYWIACAADEIFAAETSTLGSIGVVTGGYGFKDLAKKLGVEDRTFTAGKAKRRMSPLRDVSPEDKEWLEERLGKMHELFKNWIMSRRGDKVVVPEGQDKDQYLDNEIFTGDIWYGQEAVDLGLIDGVGYMDEVLREKHGDDIKISPIVEKRKGLLSMLAPFGGASAGVSMSAEEMGAAAIRTAHEIATQEVAWSPYDMK